MSSCQRPTSYDRYCSMCQRNSVDSKALAMHQGPQIQIEQEDLCFRRSCFQLSKLPVVRDTVSLIALEERICIETLLGIQ